MRLPNVFYGGICPRRAQSGQSSSLMMMLSPSSYRPRLLSQECEKAIALICRFAVVTWRAVLPRPPALRLDDVWRTGRQTAAVPLVLLRRGWWCWVLARGRRGIGGKFVFQSYGCNAMRIRCTGRWALTLSQYGEVEAMSHLESVCGVYRTVLPQRSGSALCLVELRIESF